MTRLTGPIALALCLGLFSLEKVGGTGTIALRLIDYTNPDDSGDNGNYCDGNSLTRWTKCDHYFELCMDWPNIGSDRMDSCALGHEVTPRFDNEDRVTFPSTSVYAFGALTPWTQDSIQLKIDVWDHDGTGDDDHVELFPPHLIQLIPTPNGGDESFLRYQIIGRTTLTIEIGASCDANYYGSMCNDQCIPHDDADGHFTCALDGSKICLRGYEGSLCQNVIDNCNSNPCQNGGVCSNGLNVYTCQCSQGFSGTNCEVSSPLEEVTGVTQVDSVAPTSTMAPIAPTPQAQVSTPQTCDDEPCENGGRCIRLRSEAAERPYACECPSHYSGYNCDASIDYCESNPCGSHGTCHSQLGNFTCGCDIGWSGQLCDSDVDECASSDTCLNGATCYNIPGSFRCVCAAEWEGTNCSEPKPCPCQNGGNCTYTGGNGDYRQSCLCSRGFRGDKCEEDIDECDLGVCENNATCININGSFECVCLPQWQGETCSDARQCTCERNGTCTFTGNGQNDFVCTCVEGWAGRLCEQDINECEAGGICQNGATCSNTVGSYMCLCQPEWEGADCSEAKPCPCQNGGSCSYTGSSGNYQQSCLCPKGFQSDICDKDVNECELGVCENNATCTNLNGSFECVCLPEWQGETCSDARPCTCEHNGTCTFTGNGEDDFVCTCVEGWTGRLCDQDTNECEAGGTCYNGATCTNTLGGYVCLCQPKWEGFDCSKAKSCPCQNGGSCSYIGSSGNYQQSCLCPKGLQGDICDEDVNECELGVCENNATCTNLNGGFECICLPGWQGETCSDVRSCMCEHNGTCTFTGNGEDDFDCSCETGWTGHLCEQDINECEAGGTCYNGATCSNTMGSYKCLCQPEWGGADCSEAKTCPCQNGGSCSYVEETGTYQQICDCPVGFAGDHCQEDVNECETSGICQNGASCTNTLGGYVCECTAEWQGHDCSDAKPCPCQNNGLCQYHGNHGQYNLTCDCTEGWTGDRCQDDVDECDLNVCHNGAKCHNMRGSFYCDCSPYWQGSTCSKLTMCPCVHGGSCIVDSKNKDGFHCDCLNGFVGDQCEVDVNECESDPCENGGTCEDGPNSYTCSCRAGYQGQHCQTALPPPPRCQDFELAFDGDLNDADRGKVKANLLDLIEDASDDGSNLMFMTYKWTRCWMADGSTFTVFGFQLLDDRERLCRDQVDVLFQATAPTERERRLPASTHTPEQCLSTKPPDAQPITTAEDEWMRTILLIVICVLSLTLFILLIILVVIIRRKQKNRRRYSVRRRLLDMDPDAVFTTSSNSHNQGSVVESKPVSGRVPPRSFRCHSNDSRGAY